MRRVEPKRRYSISKSQVDVLLYMRKYRFLTSDLLAVLLQKDRSTIYERLSVLVDQGYIEKQYDRSFRLRRRPATYCLAPLGIRYLKHHGIERTQIHYKSRNFTQEQIDEQLLYAKLNLALRRNYPGKFITRTKYDLERGAYVLPTPHLIFVAESDKAPDYLLEVFPAFTASWKLERRINQHVDAADEAEYTYPHILLVAGNASTEKRLVTFTADLYADFEVYVTTVERLLSGEKKTWLIPVETDFDDEEMERYALPIKLGDGPTS